MSIGPLAFSLRTERMAGRRCGLIACFGMGGTEMLIRESHRPDAIPGLVHVVSIRRCGSSQSRAFRSTDHAFDFTRDLEVNVLLEEKLSSSV